MLVTTTARGGGGCHFSLFQTSDILCFLYFSFFCYRGGSEHSRPAVAEAGWSCPGMAREKPWSFSLVCPSDSLTHAACFKDTSLEPGNEYARIQVLSPFHSLADGCCRGTMKNCYCCTESVINGNTTILLLLLLIITAISTARHATRTCYRERADPDRTAE